MEETQKKKSDNEMDSADEKEIKMESGEERVRQLMDEPDPDATATVVVPPDGGWGWVIVAASFLSNMIVDGTVFCIGVLLPEIQETFGVSKSKVAWVSSLLSGFYLMAGPFVSGLTNRYGFRIVAIAGSMVAAFGIMISYFATSVEFLFLTYGVIAGLGFCLVYMPSVIIVGFYFERWRALATGLSLCGSGVGMFVFAPICGALLKQYGWRTTMLIQASFTLCCSLFAIMYRPLKPILMSSADGAEVSKLGSVSRVGTETSQAFATPRQTRVGANNNTQYPTAAEAVFGSQMNLERRASIASTTKSDPKRSSAYSESKDVGVDPKELRPVGEDEEVGAPLINGVAPMSGVGSRRRTLSGRRPSDSGTHRDTHSQRSRRGTLTGTETSRPLYRDDVFFSGSLARLPQYQSTTSIGYHMSVTRLPTRVDVEEQARCKLCPEALRRTLATMLDMNLMRSPSFVMLAFSGFFTMMGFFVPFLYIAARAEGGGMTEVEGKLLLSAIGITNTLARITCGIIASNSGVNALWINNVALTLGGVATIFSGLWITPAYQFTFSCCFGVAIACFASLRSILVVDLMGLDKLTNAFGILMLFQGVAACVGAPLAGLFMDATGSYDASFYLAGGLITLSAVLCYPLNILKRWEELREVSNEVV